MKIVITGSEGFLGWHTRARLHALSDHEIVRVGRDQWRELPRAMDSADAVIHLAGINRASESEIEQGNVQLAEDLAAALSNASAGCRVVYAGSTQVESHANTAYGRGKAQAAAVLQRATSSGASFCEVRLPNIFGEHARPRYNTFVATFIDMLMHGETPTVRDHPVQLLHAQAAADTLISAVDGTESIIKPAGVRTTVPKVFEELRWYHDTYARGDIPDLRTQFSTDLFNTYRSAVFPLMYPIHPRINSDDRGDLVETVRSHGRGGQAFVSRTRPGKTRGNHYHLSKIERFVVISGRARISLRRLLTDTIVHYDVDGAQPSIVDMPTLWAHSITNTGDNDLITMFWTDQLFDPTAPDTYREPVHSAAVA